MKTQKNKFDFLSKIFQPKIETLSIFFILILLTLWFSGPGITIHCTDCDLWFERTVIFILYGIIELFLDHIFHLSQELIVLIELLYLYILAIIIRQTYLILKTLKKEK